MTNPLQRSPDVCGMILAAGRGERMRPLTDTLPKPLVVVRGKPLIVHHIEKMVTIGVKRIVINVSYRAEQIQRSLGNGERFGCEIVYSVEPEPLESGGGVATASAFFDRPHFILASADIYSDIDYESILQSCPYKNDDLSKKFLAHFVLVPSTPGEPGGEFGLDARGYLNEGQPRHTLASIGLIRTALVQTWLRGVNFKLLPYYREWVAAGGVTGSLFTGLRCNVSTPADVDFLNGTVR